jgi:DNA invertase Pin-like site-specific DNA recombinase
MIAASDGARLVGYARVSTQDQDLALQIDALLKYGVAKELIFTDKASGAKHHRSGLDFCLAQLRDGDVLLVRRLDRLGRSVRHLVTLIDELRDRHFGFRSVCDGAIDTTTPSGELISLPFRRRHSSSVVSFKSGPMPDWLPHAPERGGDHR